jgi:hypothetical protein
MRVVFGQTKPMKVINCFHTIFPANPSFFLTDHIAYLSVHKTIILFFRSKTKHEILVWSPQPFVDCADKNNRKRLAFNVNFCHFKVHFLAGVEKNILIAGTAREHRKYSANNQVN